MPVTVRSHRETIRISFLLEDFTSWNRAAQPPQNSKR